MLNVEQEFQFAIFFLSLSLSPPLMSLVSRCLGGLQRVPDCSFQWIRFMTSPPITRVTSAIPSTANNLFTTVWFFPFCLTCVGQ